MTITMMMVAAIMVMVIGAGLIVLNHLLQMKKEQMIMESIKTRVIPELEACTFRMMDKMFDVIPDKCVEMTKKMMKAQYEIDEDED